MPTIPGSAPARPWSFSTSRRSASIDVRGGGPGTRETALLDPAQTVEGIDAITLSGGSAFGLDAASGMQAWLKEQGRGFAVRSARVPIVPAAILFDLLNGGDKNWGRFPPYRELGYAAAAAAPAPISRSAASAPAPAPPRSTARAASARLRRKPGRSYRRRARGGQCRRQRHRRRRSVVLGGAVRSKTASSAAAACRRHFQPNALALRTKGGPRENTTLVVVATDAILTKAQAKRLAVMAQSGLSRAIYPVHTPLDGDVVFAASTGKRRAFRWPSGLDRTRHRCCKRRGAGHRARRL